MLHQDTLFLAVAFGLFAATAVYSSVSDIKRRSVNSFTFLPMFIMAALFYVFFHEFYMSILTVLLAVSTFIRTDSYVYLVLPALSFLIAIITGNLSVGVMIAILFTLLGFRETLFGIGDVKAETSYLLAFQYISRPFFSGSVFAMSFLVYISVFSILMILAFYVSALRKGLKFEGLHLRYDEEEYSKNSYKYRITGSGDDARMSYRMPFLVPINLAAIFSVLIGLPMFLY
ncbi:hypothetical membrane protein [Thermoplasma acidophilum]|uniref:Hypothetical membrane protein n=1 Tax=Thermoplasma acidophilum (strain ATCC 25905 / DSM 1728 / JCM 9062 / NBRC 15155 / AMRC-C165) TaxID=273075 RepID=Q9HLH4_THEAC|nr:hypothetical protein [Thermoplasma acidophilum]MCY0851130.1 hypothetical protein [Thermoplasma acidophilum]CAC11399.1 hypothetical membrane protein [Thermoplasma acidophilum]